METKFSARIYDQETVHAIRFVETLLEDGVIEAVDKEALRQAILEHFPPRVHVTRK
jgi:hypothetical protein